MRPELRRPLLAAAAGAVAIGALVLALAGGRDASEAGKASLFLSPSGSDAGDCTHRRPCLSFARAYALATPGAVVELAAGRYGDQLLMRDPARRAGAPVVFRPARGARVRTGKLVFGGPRTEDRGASRVTVRGIEIGGFVSQRANRLRFVDVRIAGTFAIQGGRDVAVVGGSVGGTEDGSHSEIAAWAGPSGALERPRRILVDGVRFHDVRMSRPSDHVECLQATDAAGLVIRNSRFSRCDTFDLRVDRYRTSGPRDVLIENNVFERTRDRFGGNVYYGLAVRAGQDVVIRHNSSDIGWAGPEPGTRAVEGWLVAGNAMPGGACDERIVFSHNVWAGGARCAESDRLGSPRFRAPERGDFRLRDGSPALDAGDPRAAPPRDIAGRARDERPDAGAHES